jgi:hypothetical protein
MKYINAPACNKGKLLLGKLISDIRKQTCTAEKNMILMQHATMGRNIPFYGPYTSMEYIEAPTCDDEQM